MKNQSTPAAAAPSPMGENYVLTITIPKSVHEPKYARVLQKTSQQVTLPGFRRGKAPLRLVEEQVSPASLLDKVLEKVLPELYAKAVDAAKIEPLVAPQIKIVSIEPGKDWVVEAHTALAPKVTLGDWQKIVKQASEKHAKDAKAHEGHDHAKDQTEKEKEQELLSAIFAALIEKTNPAIPPLLLEQESRRQIEELARTLASHRIELDQFLKSTGKTVEALQQEYTLSGLANLQVEFTLQAITEDLQPEVSDEEIEKLLGKKLSTFPKENQAKLKNQAEAMVKRQKTVAALTAMAQK